MGAWKLLNERAWGRGLGKGTHKLRWAWWLGAALLGFGCWCLKVLGFGVLGFGMFGFGAWVLGCVVWFFCGFGILGFVFEVLGFKCRVCWGFGFWCSVC